MKSTEKSPDRPAAADRHLWQLVPLRDLLWGGAGLLAIVLIDRLGSILMPIFFGLVGAYLLNPLVTWLHQRWHLPRPATVLFIMVLVSAATAGAGFWLAPLLVDQFQTLVDRAPEYLARLEKSYGIQLADLLSPLRERLEELKNNPATAFRLFEKILGTTTEVVLWMVLVPLYFFFFSWKFQGILSYGDRLLPTERFPRLREVLAKVDEGVGLYFRARLLICLIIGLVFAGGWWLAEVPYWFLLGGLAGAFSMIPYLSILAWLLALLLKYLDTSLGGGEFSLLAVLVWPSVVFGVGNFLEGWVLTPWIHGRTTHLSPVTVLTIILVGGSLGGFWGLLFSLPIAISLDILGREYLVPRLSETDD